MMFTKFVRVVQPHCGSHSITRDFSVSASVHSDYKYLAFNKPYKVLSQFTQPSNQPESGDKKQTLSDFIFEAEKDVYPVGRLDEDSEGLLILTNDTRLNNYLTQPRMFHRVSVSHLLITPSASRSFEIKGSNTKKTYYVLVDGVPDEADVAKLENGDVKFKTKYKTEHRAKPMEVRMPSATPPTIAHLIIFKSYFAYHHTLDRW